VLLLAALVLPPLAAAQLGARGPLEARLDLGPGDAPYLRGFLPYDAASGSAMRWTRAEAAIDLPLTVSGGGAFLLRFAPPRGGRARVDLAIAGRPLDSFECCQRQEFQRHRVDLPAGAPVPLELQLRVAAPEAPELGLFLDWVRIEAKEGARVRLRGPARGRAAALVGVAFVLLLLSGFTASRAAIAVAPLALGLTVGLLTDPWLVHRLLTSLPESLLLFGLLAIGLARGLERFGLIAEPARRGACALALLVFVLRGGALNHPGYYYPDLTSHARRTAVVRRAGLDALISPAKYVETPAAKGAGEGRTASGLWLYRIGEEHYPLPYSLLPYAPLAALGRDHDGTIAALKMAAASVSALAVVLLAAVATGLSAPGWSALLYAAAPTAAAELSFASYPALFGHLFDLSLLLFLMARADAVDRPRVFLTGAFLLAAAQLAYVSSPVTTSLILLGLSTLQAFEGGRARRRALLLLLLLATGAGLALALYYRDFVPGALAAVRAALASARSAHPARPGPGLIDGALATWAIPVVLACALVGLPRLLRRGRAGTVLAGTILGLGLVAGLKLRLPVVFGFVHLALLATPLVCVAAASGLEALMERGRVPRGAALLLLAVAVGQGLVLQARLFADQIDRLR
jgi:hypothetical protein